MTKITNMYPEKNLIKNIYEEVQNSQKEDIRYRN